MDIAATVTDHPPARSLFGPWADVMLLGGASLLAMALLHMMHLQTESLVKLGMFTLILANFVNHPHFAFSYQLFYGSWADLKAGRMAPDLRRRWLIAGVIAPVVLAVFLLTGALLSVHGQNVVLALTLSSMGLLVGWHYVKQGFGMAMMDAALKKRYWPAPTRKALLMNAYACWGAAWTLANSGATAQELWGVLGIHYAVPGAVAFAACTVAGLTTIWCALALFRCISGWRAQALSWKQWPAAGLTAYFITLYIWLGLVYSEPAFLLVIPFFHSLQYLTVVSRYKVNEMRAQRWRSQRLATFVLTGAVLGALGFWVLPAALDYVRTGHLPDKGVALGMACAWIFINVHHYLIDNVLWRQGNPKVKQFLFDPQPD
ncbi:MAG: hypothetical protein V4484_02030 [Pseudomonadota bacterium]